MVFVACTSTGSARHGGFTTQMAIPVGNFLIIQLMFLTFQGEPLLLKFLDLVQLVQLDLLQVARNAVGMMSRCPNGP